MPLYDDPRINEIITSMQLNALRDLGYMLVREREVRDTVLYDEWLDELFEDLSKMLEKRVLPHPNFAGLYHLRHRIKIVDGVYEDPDKNANSKLVWEES